MPRFRAAWVASAIGCLVALSSVFAQAALSQAAKPPVEAFGNLPAFSHLRLSPDGEHLAMLRATGGRNAVVIVPVHPKPGDKPRGISDNLSFFDGIVWLNNERLAMIVKANLKPPGYDEVQTFVRALATNIDGSNQVMMLNNLKGFGVIDNNAGFLNIAPDDPQHVYMVAPTLSAILGWHLDIYKVDVDTGRGEIHFSGQGETCDWLADGDGYPVARTDCFSKPLKDRIVLKDGIGWKHLETFDTSGDKGTGLSGLSDDKSALIIAGIDDRGFKSLFSRNLKTDESKPLFDAGKYDVDDTVEDPWTSRVIGATYMDDTSQTVFFDKALEGARLSLKKAVPDVTLDIVSWDRARNTIIFMIDGPKQPPVYYLYDAVSNQAKPIAYTYPTLKPSDLGEMKPYPYKARDGLEIPAYITLPPGKVAKNLPAVVMPHGGPDARDALGFDWWTQFLANRGYVVLQPNFRGSSGYGRAFTEAGLGQWGLKMQDDITDGVKKMIADGIVDPKRICIVGASYGGYAALAGATFTPDLYACAASWAGVSDLRNMYDLSAGGKSSEVAFWLTRMSGDFKQLEATSPSYHADKVRVPVLLMHGEGDTTVRIEQSEKEEKALKKAGKKVEFIRFAGGEDHYLNTAETRIKVLTTLEKFLKENIGD